MAEFFRDVHLTNGYLLDLWRKDEHESIKDLAAFLEITVNALKLRLKRLKERYQIIRKGCNRPGSLEKIETFLKENYKVPLKKMGEENHTPNTACKNCVSMLNANEVQRELLSRKRKQHEEEVQNVVHLGESERRICRQKIRKVHKSTGLKNASDVLRELRRTKADRRMWMSKYKKLRRDYAILTDKCSKAMKRAECHRLKASRAAKDTGAQQEKTKRVFSGPDEDVIKLQDKVSELQAKLAVQESTMPTKDGQCFNPKIREISYYLQNLGVAESNVSEVIRLVSECLHGRKIGRLPSKSTQGRMASEMKVISRKQVQENIEEEVHVAPLTLKYDGTTKGRLGHLAEVEVATSSKTYVTGIRQQVGGSAAEYLESIKNSCDDIDLGLLQKIENTMTDRCSTNMAIDRNLEQLTGKKVNSFRCAMHPLDTFAREANKSLNKLDAQGDHLKDKKLPFNRRNECNAQALIRAASKLFNNEGCGETATLCSYLNEKGIKQRIPRFVGNRFNILFHSSTVLFSLGSHIVEYFRSVQKPSNDLHRAFVNAWTAGRLEHLRCLGLIDMMVTGPWMKVIGENPNILDMNPAFNNARKTLEEWIDDPTRMVNERRSVFGEEVVEDNTLLTLTSITAEQQPGVTKVLKALLQGILDVVNRQLHSQLPGGQFWDPSPALRQAATSCVAHNISGERNFAIVDAHLKKAPNISIGKIEARVMFQGNKTQSWLNRKGKHEKEKLIQKSIKIGSTERSKEKLRKDTYHENVKKRVREKQSKLSEKEERERGRTEDIIEGVLDRGLWEEREQIMTQMKQMSKTKQRDALRKQFLFRTKILGCDLGKHTFTKTSSEELIDLLINNQVPDEDIVQITRNPAKMVEKEFHHKWEDKGEMWYHGRILHIVDGEYAIKYDNDTDVFFMTLSEFLTDVHLGDISLVT